ncbi:MAG: bifunctional folylpolyglutamate synthase/dihydrofolate synthase [Deltaproteobacteria bacterium]|jgi:dihydrofolate synthase/folylpolyglutamate synthase|nr:bifunctional folylpolyglutamate synthase/dihydrofolate synthase [Deltaproteobacteria bacterium]
MTYSDAITRLFGLQTLGMKFGLESVETILSSLGNPEKALKCVHVSGTNGKGSTAALLEAVLRESGLKTGLYTSPHLVTFRERMRINGVMVSEEDVVGLAEEVWKVIDPEKLPTFFEFVTSMAFLYFKREKVDVAVVETGLGGRLDSTNTIKPLISAVTNVGLEHTEILGDTLEKIAFEKAGIIKKNVPFVGGRMAPEALGVIEAKLREVGVRGKLFGRDYRIAVAGNLSGRPAMSYEGLRWKIRNLVVPFAGEYQADNAGLALAILEELAALGYEITEERIVSGFAGATWPGRGEEFPPGTWPADKSGKATLILDGAHNPEGARAFGKYLESKKGGNIHLVTGVMADKDIEGVLGPVLSRADYLYLTRPVYFRAASPGLLLEKIRGAFGEPSVPFTLHEELPKALEAASLKAGPEDLVVVTGSLFVVGEARASITGEKTVETN